jgi:hypothetical protein
MAALRLLALYPFQHETYLSWYHTVFYGPDLTDSPTLLTSFLLLPAYRETADFREFKVANANVRMLMAIPITDAERQFAREHGSESLENLLVKKGYNFITQETRRSVV